MYFRRAIRQTVIHEVQAISTIELWIPSGTTAGESLRSFMPKNSGRIMGGNWLVSFPHADLSKTTTRDPDDVRKVTTKAGVLDGPSINL